MSIVDVYLKKGLENMTPAEQAELIKEICQRFGLDPLLRPIDIIEVREPGSSFKRKVLYATKAAADAIRARNKLNDEIVESHVDEEVAWVVLRVWNDERSVYEVGASPVVREKDGKFYPSPAMRANALMRAITKAKRRAALSWEGLSLLDESELDTVDVAVPEEPKAEAQPQPARKPLREVLQEVVPEAKLVAERPARPKPAAEKPPQPEPEESGPFAEEPAQEAQDGEEEPDALPSPKLTTTQQWLSYLGSMVRARVVSTDQLLKLAQALGASPSMKPTEAFKWVAEHEPSYLDDPASFIYQAQGM